MKTLSKLSYLTEALMTRLNSEFLIGHFRVQPSTNKIFFSNKEIKITPLLMSILTLLAARQGETVTKQQLLDEVWGKVSVSEAALFRNISELRRIFGDDAKTQNFIETIPKKGYRLKAEVIFLDKQQFNLSGEKKTNLLFKLLSITFILLTIGAFGRLFFWDKPVEYQAPSIEYLTSDKANQRRPRISKSGRFILYFNNNKGKRSLVLNDSESNADTTLLESFQGISSASFSPDEQDIIYALSTAEKCEIHQLSLISKVDNKLFECESKPLNSMTVDWSLDNRYYLFGSPAEKNGYLSFSIADTQTGEVIDLELPETYSMYYPRFSPDSTKIVYVATPFSAGLTHEIGIFDLQTQKSKIIYSSNDFILQVTWAENNQDIYFLVGAGKNNAKGLWHINSETKLAKHLLNGDFLDMDYNSKNDQFVLSQIQSQRNIWAYSKNVSTENPTRFTDSNLIDREATLSPDKKTLAFVSNRSGNNEIWLKSLQDDSLKQITQFNNSSLSIPQWLPSGQKLSFNITENRQKEFFLFDLKSNGFEKIKLPNSADAIDWESDEVVFWTSLRPLTNETVLNRTNLKTDKTTQVATMPISFFRYHPVFGIIYSPYSDSKRLFTFSLERQKHELLEDIRLSSPTSWDFFENQLFYISRNSNSANSPPNFGIHSFNLATREKTYVSDVKVPRIQDFGRTLLSVDENYIFYTGLENVAIDLISVSFH